MKLYFSQGRWQVPGQQDKKAERREVPTDSAGLCAFLNELQGDENKGCPDDAVVELPIERPVMVAEKPVYQHSHNTRALRDDVSFTASEIEDFILNRATVAQVGNIFECIGTRFAEERKVA